MPLRTRLFIIITIVVLIILGISIFLVVSSKKTRNDKTSETTAQTTDALGSATQLSDQSGNAATSSQVIARPLTTLEAEKNGVRQLAKIFAERYGSYSTDNEYQNLKEVKNLCTVSLWSSISGLMSGGKSSSFVGVTTEAVSAKLSYWDGVSAKVELNTSRAEEKNGLVSKKNQEAIVYLIKSSSGWLVDKFEWK